jgi:hypothetical protein
MCKRLIGFAVICATVLVFALILARRSLIVTDSLRFDNKSVALSKEAVALSLLMKDMIPPLPDPGDPAFYERLRVGANRMKDSKDALQSLNQLSADFIKHHAHVLSVLTGTHIGIDAADLSYTQKITDLRGKFNDRPAEQVAEINESISKILEEVELYDLTEAGLRKLDEGLANFERASRLR